jgi:hypothetical protein
MLLVSNPLKNFTKNPVWGCLALKRIIVYFASQIKKYGQQDTVLFYQSQKRKGNLSGGSYSGAGTGSRIVYA